MATTTDAPQNHRADPVNRDSGTAARGGDFEAIRGDARGAERQGRELHVGDGPVVGAIGGRDRENPCQPGISPHADDRAGDRPRPSSSDLGRVIDHVQAVTAGVNALLPRVVALGTSAAKAAELVLLTAEECARSTLSARPSEPSRQQVEYWTSEAETRRANSAAVWKHITDLNDRIGRLKLQEEARSRSPAVLVPRPEGNRRDCRTRSRAPKSQSRV